jgi:DNA-binding NarL/FixJ family response regulator
MIDLSVSLEEMRQLDDAKRCGFRAFCGRPADHRGHHGGWRSKIRAVTTSDYQLDCNHGVSTHDFGAELTPWEVRVLAEIVEHGLWGPAAVCLDRSKQTVKNHVAIIHEKTGAHTTIDSLRNLGWLLVPVGAGHSK